jgi:hypothetical protein
MGEHRGDPNEVEAAAAAGPKGAATTRRDLLKRTAIAGAAGTAAWAAPAILSIDAAGAATAVTPTNGCVTSDGGVCDGNTSMTVYTLTNTCGVRVAAVAVGIVLVIDAGASITINGLSAGPMGHPLPVEFFVADAHGQPVGIAFQTTEFGNIC